MMEDLEQNVMLQSYAQRDPLNEYRILGTNMYSDMINEVRNRTVLRVLTCRIEKKQNAPGGGIRNLRSGRTAAPKGPAPAGQPSAPVRRTGNKVGPNDPCPCGSGKKYKKCCGAGSRDAG